MNSSICSQCQREGCSAESEWCIINITENRNKDLIEKCHLKPADEAVKTLRREIGRLQLLANEYMENTKFAFRKYETASSEYIDALQNNNGIATEESRRSIRAIKDADHGEYVHISRIARCYNDSLTELWEAYDLILVKSKQES